MVRIGTADALRHEARRRSSRRPRLDPHDGGRRLNVSCFTLVDGGQPAERTAHALADFVGVAQHKLEIAIYDLRLPDPLAQIVRGALESAAQRGVDIRLAYNLDCPEEQKIPPPPRTEPGLLESLPFPTAAIPGVPDLMHHKYVIRDRASVWTGSTNWTADSWTREENVVVTVDSAGLAARYLDDFETLWSTRDVAKTGKVDQSPVDGIRAWFCPGRGGKLAHRIAKAIGTAQRRVRIASPVISSGPILGTLAQVASDGKVDIAGVVDATQVHEVLHQWRENGNAPWKEPLLRTSLTRAPFSGKHSTPYRPGSVHDYMHAKITVADDTVFVGSFNLSHSGELNAENVLEIVDPTLAETLAAFIDGIRAKYPAVELPA